MDMHQFLHATTASEKIGVKTSPLGPSRPGDSNGNAANYRRGRQIAHRVARHGAQGEDPVASIKKAAVDMGLDAKEARSAVRFMEAVDLIAACEPCFTTPDAVIRPIGN